jgi:hypothetical protein
LFKKDKVIKFTFSIKIMIFKGCSKTGIKIGDSLKTYLRDKYPGRYNEIQNRLLCLVFEKYEREYNKKIVQDILNEYGINLLDKKISVREGEEWFTIVLKRNAK